MILHSVVSKNLFRECYATFVCDLFTLLNGLMYAFPACLIPQLQKDGYSLDTLSQSLLGSAGVFVVSITTPLAIFLVGKTGRKPTIQITLVLVVILLAITMFSTSVPVLCCTLSIASAVGISSSPTETQLFLHVYWDELYIILPIAQNGPTLTYCIFCQATSQIFIDLSSPLLVAYISETCKKERRGVFLISAFVSYSSGSAVIFIFNSFAHWRIIAAFLILIALSCLCQTLLLPESPYYQLLVGKKVQAKNSLQWFQPDLNATEVQRKIENVERSLIGTRTTKGQFEKLWMYLRDKTVLKPLFIGILVSFIRCGDGRVILSMYLYNILRRNLRVPYDLEKWTAIYGIVYLVYVVGIVAITRKLKRKPAIYLWCSIMAVFLIIVIIYKFLYNANVDVPIWVPVVAIYIHLLVATSGLYPATYTIAMELQVAYCRPEMATLLNGATSIFFCMYTFIFPHVDVFVPIEYVLMYFLLNIAVLPIVVKVLVPETSSFEFYDTMDKQNREAKEVHC